MRNKIILVVLMLVCSTAFAEDYICYDSNNENARYIHSIDPSKKPLNCSYVPTSLHDEIKQKTGGWYFKGIDGYPVKKDQTEIDSILQSEAEAQKTAFYDGMKAELENPTSANSIVLHAVMDEVIEEIRALKANNPKSNRTKEELVLSVKNRIDAMRNA